MLYDKRWDKQTKANPFTLESVAAWLEKQPADEKYDYFNCDGECALDQYLISAGRYSAGSGNTYCRISNLECGNDNLGHAASCHPRTFGALLSRVRVGIDYAAR